MPSPRLIDDEGLRCPDCGYNLTGNLAAGINRCPECGKPVRASQAAVEGVDPAGESTALDWQSAAIPAGLLGAGELWRGFAPDFGVSLLLAAAAAYAWGVRLARRRGDENPFASAVAIGGANFVVSLFAVAGLALVVRSIA